MTRAAWRDAEQVTVTFLMRESRPSAILVALGDADHFDEVTRLELSDLEDVMMSQCLTMLLRMVEYNRRSVEMTDEANMDLTVRKTIDGL